jgi:Leucine-rich repeat (LRR) protein
MLELSNIAVSDVTPLQHLAGLQTLVLRNTAVSDIRPLRNLTELQVLDLVGTDVEDMSVLVKLLRLRALFVSRHVDIGMVEKALPHCEVFWR